MSTSARTHGDRDRLRFDRGDRVATTILLWLAVLATAVAPIAVVVDWLARRRVVLAGVPVDVDPAAAGVGQVVGPVQAAVQVDGVWGGHLALYLLPALLVLGATVWGAVLLSRFLRDLGRGEPFAAANVARLRIVALLIIVVPILVSMVESIARTEILRAQGLPGADAWSMDITLVWVIVGFLVAAVAQAFAAGARLQDDVEGLV